MKTINTFITYILIFIPVILQAQWLEINRPNSPITDYKSVDFAQGFSNTGYLIGNGFESSSYNVFFKTINGGLNWSGPINIISNVSGIYPEGIACLPNGQTVYIIGQQIEGGITKGVILKSINGGASFTSELFVNHNHELGETFTDIEILDNVAVVVGYNGLIYINPDINSSCWYKYNTNSSICFKDVTIGKDANNNYYIYAIGRWITGVYKVIITNLCQLSTSSNSMIYFDGIPSNGSLSGIAVQNENAKDIIAAYYNKLYFSHDYGNSWTITDLSSLYPYSEFYDISTTNNYIYLAGYCTGPGATKHCVLEYNITNNTYNQIIFPAMVFSNNVYGPCSIDFKKNANASYSGYFVGNCNKFYKKSSSQKSGEFSDWEEFSINQPSVDHNKIDIEVIRVICSESSIKIELNSRMACEQGIKIYVTDLTGRTVIQYSTSNLISGINLIEIPSTNLPSGVYLIAGISQNVSFSNKIVKL